MHAFLPPPALPAVSLFFLWTLAGCGGSDSDSDDARTGFVQVVNAIVDAPTLAVVIEEGSERTLPFQGSTGLVALNTGNRSFEISYTDPATNDAEVLVDEFDERISNNTIHTLYLTGAFDNPQLIWLDKEVGDVTDDPDLEEAEIEVVNLVTGDAVDVYLGDPDVSLGAGTLLATLSEGGTALPAVFAAGDYRVRVTAAGETDILYDSGAFDVDAATRRTVVLHDGIGADRQALAAFQLLDDGAVAATNAAAPATVRVVNAIADDTAAVVEIRDPATGDTLEMRTLAFPEIGASVAIDAGFVDVALVTASDPSVGSTATISLNEATAYTVIAAGSAFDDEISLRAGAADNRPTATLANVQFFNTLRETDVEDLDEVDLYALPLGDSLDDTAPLFTRIGYLGNSDGTLAGDQFYDFVITTAGTQSILAGPVRRLVDERSSLLIFSAEAFGGGAPAQLVLEVVE